MAEKKTTFIDWQPMVEAYSSQINEAQKVAEVFSRESTIWRAILAYSAVSREAGLPTLTATASPLDIDNISNHRELHDCAIKIVAILSKAQPTTYDVIQAQENVIYTFKPKPNIVSRYTHFLS